jgi:outer membrane protein assembly factor BamB
MQNFRISDGKQQNISLSSSKKFSQTYTFDESKCFVIEINGTLKAFDYNGVEITWNSGISSSSNQFSNIVVGGEYLYFSPHDGFMYCLDKKTGIVVWKSEYFNPSDTKLFIHNNILYAYSKNGNLNAFELKKGFSLLNQSFGEKGSDCFFNKENNLIYVATQRKICSFRPL